jgi:hypothetical protein
MGDTPPGAALPLLSKGFQALAEEITDYPGQADGLKDHALLAAHAWFEGNNHALAQEVRTRAGHYKEQAARWAAYLPPDQS